MGPPGSPGRVGPPGEGSNITDIAMVSKHHNEDILIELLLNRHYVEKKLWHIYIMIQLYLKT